MPQRERPRDKATVTDVPESGTSSPTAGGGEQTTGQTNGAGETSTRGATPSNGAPSRQARSSARSAGQKSAASAPTDQATIPSQPDEAAKSRPATDADATDADATAVLPADVKPPEADATAPLPAANPAESDATAALPAGVKRTDPDATAALPATTKPAHSEPTAVLPAPSTARLPVLAQTKLLIPGRTPVDEDTVAANKLLSAVSMSGAAAASVPTHAARRKSVRVPLIIVSALAAVLLVATGVMTYLYVDRDKAYHRQVGVVHDRNATITANADQIRKLTSELAAANARVTELQQQVAASGGQVTELQQEKSVLGTCINSINEFFTVVGNGGTTTEQNAAQTKMESDCAAAQKYLH